MEMIRDQFLKDISGYLVMGIIWLARTVYKAKNDLDMAHAKIRSIEKGVANLEDDLDGIAGI